MSSKTISLNSLEQVYTGESLDLKKLADYLHLSMSEMADIAGVAPKTVYRGSTSPKTAKGLNPLLYTIKLLLELTNNDIVKVRRWLREPLVEWRGMSPLESLQQGKMNALKQLVERISYGDSAGY